MVAEAITVGQGWRTRPDIVAVQREESALPVVPIPATERGVKISEARKLAAQRRFEERLATAPRGQEGELVYVRAGDVRFDERYQLPERYDEKRARRMGADWDHNQEVPITVNVRPDDPTGTIWCPDGKHRTNAILFRFGPDQRIKAVLHRVPYEQEAAMFKRQDDNRKRVSVALKFNAGKEANDPIDTEIQSLADRLGVTLSAVRSGARTLPANTFIILCRSKGIETVEHAMRLLLDRWDGAAESMDARIIKGTVFFVARYQGDPRYKPGFVADALAHASVDSLFEEGSKFRVQGEHLRIALAIRAFYNRKRSSRRLPEWSDR